jgi:GntR family histidine utilization transcriptional repressor
MKSASERSAQPLYKQVKRYVADRIASGKWPPGYQAPTEFELTAKFRMSRPTIHRALRELMQEGLLTRIPGKGTFVAEFRPHLDLLEIHNIADDIASRGHVHRCEVHLLRRERATPNVMSDLGLPIDHDVYHSLMVHFEGGWAVQLEERYVNPIIAPDYLKQDFTRTTPNAYLTLAAPLDRAEHTVEAIRPSKQMQKLLHISAEESCLLLHRRTWWEDRVVTRAWLTHPGSRYRMGAKF